MIENERQLQAARESLRYWKRIAADGEQSWLGGENAREEVMRYARVISAYERREASRRGGREPGNAAPPASMATEETGNA